MRCGWPCQDLGSENMRGPSALRIRVEGQLPASAADRWGEMDIAIEWHEGQPVTELRGAPGDHAALAEVLATLDELHLPLLSVEPVELADTIC